jgi:hypothetical protein
VARQWTPGGKIKIAKAYLFYDFKNPSDSDSDADPTTTTSPGTSAKKKKKRSGKKRQRSLSKTKSSTLTDTLPMAEDSDLDLEDRDKYPAITETEDGEPTMHVLDALHLKSRASRMPAAPKTQKGDKHKRSSTLVKETHKEDDPELSEKARERDIRQLPGQSKLLLIQTLLQRLKRRG